MEKELLILGIVRQQALHGYRLWELLSAVPMGVRLKRSNAYRILDSLQKRGLIGETVEREGNRPERRVYEITSIGEKAFQEMLRESLGNDARVDLPNAVALNYLDVLGQDEVIRLLRVRLASVEARVAENADLSDGSLQRLPGVAFAVAYDRFERDFLTGLIERFSSTQS
jgi:DNA-binding PadR family transcriptional regulator